MPEIQQKSYYIFEFNKLHDKLHDKLDDKLDVSYTFIINNISISTYGYVITLTEDKLTQLYCSESGLGLEIVREHGINNITYIQFDLSDVITNINYASILKISIIGTYRIAGSAIKGVLGSTIYTSDKTDKKDSIQIPYFGTYRYISIIASGNKDSIIIIKSIEFENN